MSLTWGRRYAHRPRVSTGRRILLLLCAAAIGVVAATQDSLVARPQALIESETRGTIQGLFDLHIAAIERRDRVSYELTLDPRTRAFVACMNALFDSGPERAAALAPGRIVSLEHLPGTNVLRVRLQQHDGIAVHYARRFLIGPVTAFPWIDLMRSVPAWYLSYAEPGDLRNSSASPPGESEGTGCGREGPVR